MFLGVASRRSEEFRKLLESPWKSWLESCFQEYVKLGGSRFEVSNEEYSIHTDFHHHLTKLDSVFGSRQVQAVPFRPDRFPGGCVVHDFCSRLEIPLAARQIHRANEGLSLPALQLLYTYRKVWGGMEPGLQSIIRNEILCRRLLEVTGPRFRFHPRLVEPVLSPLAATIPSLEQRLGNGFCETRGEGNLGACLENENDLLEIGTKAREWLSQATGQPRIPSGSEHHLPQLAGQMHHLFEHPSFSSRLRWHRDIFTRRIRHWLRDV